MIKKRRRGTTLIELLVAIVILSIMMVVFSSIYTNSIKTFQQELTQAQLQADSQLIVDNIINDIKSAQSVEANYDTYSSDTDSIILKVPAVDANQNFLYTGSVMVFDRIIYYKSGPAIHKIIYADTNSNRYALNGLNKTLSSNVTGLTFNYYPDNILPTAVSTTIQLTKNVGKFNRSVILTSKAKMRNNL